MVSLPDSPTPQRLQIGLAVQEGWRAFRRAPWPFMAFALLLLGLQAIASRWQESGPLALVGSLATLLINVWGVTGLVRGAWCALEGGRPSLLTLLRWDGPAVGRLFLATLLFSLLLGLLFLPLRPLVEPILQELASAAASGRTPDPTISSTTAISLLLAAAFTTYLAVSQSFLAQIALLRGPGPWGTLVQGRRGVDRQWGRVLALHLLEGLLLLAGAMACLVGILPMLPLASCISTAAYRQIFGREDHTGLSRRDLAPGSAALNQERPG
jgi:hypothetical protein